MTIPFLVNCSAVLANKRSPVDIDPCPNYWSAYTDAALMATAATGYGVLKDNFDNYEVTKAMLGMAAVGFAVSTFMGYGYCLKDKRE